MSARGACSPSSSGGSLSTAPSNEAQPGSKKRGVLKLPQFVVITARSVKVHTRLDINEIRQLSGKPELELHSLGDVAALIDSIGYLHDWRADYRVKSVAQSLGSEAIMCIDAAILACGLMDVFPEARPRLLAIHRRAPDGEECGHVAAVFTAPDGRLGAFAKSNYPGLGHREARYSSETALALSFARAYLQMNFTPLYFGFGQLDELSGEIDWRRSPQDLGFLSTELCSRYTHAFSAKREARSHAS